MGGRERKGDDDKKRKRIIMSPYRNYVFWRQLRSVTYNMNAMGSGERSQFRPSGGVIVEESECVLGGFECEREGFLDEDVYDSESAEDDVKGDDEE